MWERVGSLEEGGGSDGDQGIGRNTSDSAMGRSYQKSKDKALQTSMDVYPSDPSMSSPR